MKIVSWNANGKFREKFRKILALNADIYVIQECENPATCKDAEYHTLFEKSLWVGDLPYKGLMVYSLYPSFKLELLDWEQDKFRYFIPVRVNNSSFTLVGAWACEPYVEEFTDFIHASDEHIDNDVIIIGDLNSSVQFDAKHRKSGKTHEALVAELRTRGIEDMYHYLTGEQQGEEQTMTFYLYRHLDKPYHLDHCFSNPKNIKSLVVHSPQEWLALSDHMPIEIITA